jgi:enterochelin esterase-like enzyme
MNTQASEVVSDSFKSNALGHDYKIRVYLPDDYKAKEQLFPVIYLLHGAGGNETSWTAQDNAKEILDALIKRGSMRSSIAVMPDGGNSWWIDGAAEKAETALMDELLPYVEGKYRIASQRRMRAIGGISMGGYGALNLALKFPDKFCAAALLSPAIYDPAPPKNSAALSARQFFKEGKFDIELWKSLNYPARLDAYNKTAQKVSMWIVSGDHDSLGIALQSAQFYWRLFQTQPKQIELRIIDGDHEWMVWRDALPDALRYLDEQCARSK